MLPLTFPSDVVADVVMVIATQAFCLGVTEFVRVQPEDTSPALRDMTGRSATYGAEAKNDDVMSRHGDGPS
jgi:hypothetical protein